MAMEQTSTAQTESITLKLKSIGEKLQRKADMVKKDTVEMIKDPEFQTLCISTSGGAIVLGSAGGAFGCASGVVIGGSVGVVPALLTFGLSIPAGAAIGGGMGFCSGAAAGAIGGGVAGNVAYKHRVYIKDGLIYIKTETVDNAKAAQIKITGVIKDTVNNTKVKVSTLSSKSMAEATKIVNFTQDKVGALMKKPIELAKDSKVQVTTAGAAAGTVAGGAVGGGTGVLVGAAVGVIPALFTFGLSIPVCAAVGGGIGLCTGSSVGAVGGGAAGFAGYKYRKELGASMDKSKDFVNSKVTKVKEFVSGTGGTA
jgi:hypothetical protein